jgi:PilZ domain
MPWRQNGLSLESEKRKRSHQKKMDFRSRLCDLTGPNCFFFRDILLVDRRAPGVFTLGKNSVSWRLEGKMGDLDRRKFDRTGTLNLVDYVILGEDGSPVSRGMGRTRNVSEVGLLLETHRPLTEGQTVLITLGLKDETVQFRGRIMHQETPASFFEETRYCAGVKFTAVNKQGSEVLNRYIQALRNSGRD